MNTHPSSSQNHRANKASRVFGATTAKVRGATYTAHNRSSSSQQKPCSLQQQPSSPALTQTEMNTLLRRKALAEANQGNHDEAIALFSLLIENSPENANNYSNRGLVYFQTGQFAKALADYNRAIELNPSLDSAYNNRANYYAAQGQFLEAILDYDVALDLNPTNVRAWINQGITFRELEMYDRAIESFELALCLNKLEGHVYAERGRAYHLRGDWNCAVGDYYRALDRLPESVTFPHNASDRLRFQVETWLDELISPLEF